MPHNFPPQGNLLGPLQGLGEKICPHFLSGTALDRQIALGNLVGEKEITNVNCTSPLGGTLFSILQKQYRGLRDLLS